MPTIPLCKTAEFGPEDSKEFTIDLNDQSIDIFVIHHNQQYYAYINQCPHTGATLNWQPNQFFDMYNEFIQCSTHGALFRVDDGYCVRGPCAGAYLQALKLCLEDDTLLINAT